MTIKWFGESWNNTLCRDCPHVSVPVGVPCIHCARPLKDGDQGIIYVNGPVAHLDCLLDTLGITKTGVPPNSSLSYFPKASSVSHHQRLLVNKAKCLQCNEIIESTHRHDFKQCSCGNLAVDGGLDYARRVFTTDRWEELSQYAPPEPKG